MHRLITTSLSALVVLLSFSLAGTPDGPYAARPWRGSGKQPVAVQANSITPPNPTFGVPYYTDNFDGTNDTTSLKTRGYKIYYRGTGPQGIAPIWFQGNPVTFVAFNGPTNGYVGSNFNSVTDANVIDNWLVLPALNVTSGDSLYFYERSVTANPFPDSIAVMYSAAGDSTPEAGTWTMLGYFRTTETGSWARRGFRAPTAGSTARWAIRYLVYDGGPSGTNSNYIGIDALTVEGAAGATDISALANVAPSGNVLVNIAVTPQATFRNVGTSAQSGIPVSYSISPGGYTNTQTIGALASNTSSTVSFASFTPTTAGAYSYTIIVSLGGDQNRGNDTLRGTFNAVAYSGGGGPNDGGYYYANSLATTAPSHPNYGWVDPVAGGHTAITTWTSGDGDDGYFGNTPIGFPFNFFGANFDSVFIGSNGYVTFGTGTATTASTAAIPAAATPNNWIAGCAMDMDASSTYPNARVYYGGNTTQFVVTYQQVHRWTSAANTDSITFQIILYSNGNIKIQYNDALTNNPPPPTILGDALVGIENSGGTAGISYRNDGSGPPMFGSPLAVEFGTNPNTLPVQLASFTGTRLSPTSVRLLWLTISEVNNYGFYVERRTGTNGQFIEVPNSFVAGHGTTNEPHTYAFVDNTIPNPAAYQYRLRQVDLDGTTHFTEPINVTMGATGVAEIAPREFALLQNYPNPFNPATQIKFSVEQTARTTLVVFTTLGQKVATVFDDVAEAGRFYRVTLSASNFPSGVYYYQLRSGARSDLKKMLLLK